MALLTETAKSPVGRLVMTLPDESVGCRTATTVLRLLVGSEYQPCWTRTFENGPASVTVSAPVRALLVNVTVAVPGTPPPNRYAVPIPLDPVSRTQLPAANAAKELLEQYPAPFVP